MTKGEKRMETKIVSVTRNEGKTHSVCSLAALGCSIVRRPTIVQFVVTTDYRRSFLVSFSTLVLFTPLSAWSSLLFFLSNLRRIRHLTRFANTHRRRVHHFFLSRRDAPSKRYVVLLVALFGGARSVISVFWRYWISQKKKKKNDIIPKILPRRDQIVIFIRVCQLIIY